MMTELVMPICRPCWDERYHGAEPLPISIKDSVVEICFVCQEETTHGIYVRIVPEFLEV